MTEDTREIFFNPYERYKYEEMWKFHQYRTTSPAEVICDHIATLFRANYISGSRLIDFGCGTGRILDHFIDAGYDVLGVDIAHNCLDEAMRQRVPLLIADLTSLPKSVKGDFGICVDVLEHLPPSQVNAAIDNIARAAPHGCFIRVANFPETHGQNLIAEDLHLTLWCRNTWESELRKSFDGVAYLPLKEDSKPERYSFWCVK